MVDKKMDIIEFLISNGLLSKKQIDSVLASYQLLLKEDVGLNKAQLLRIQKVVDNIIRYNELYSKISHSKNIPRQEKSKLYKELESMFGIARKPKEGLFDDCKHNALEEIRRYRMENDQCTYMLYDVQKLIKENKLEDKIILLGYLNQETLREYTRKATFVVIPSVWYENCPYSALETQAIGKAIIGADIGGIPELVKNEENGLIYKFDDIKDLEDKRKVLSKDACVELGYYKGQVFVLQTLLEELY